MSSRKSKTKSTTARSEESYETLVGEVQSLVEIVRQQAARSVNSVMTATYWFIGRRIVEEEQKGKRRANYGKQLIKGLSTDLTDRLGRGFGERNLRHMRAFYRSRPTLLDPPSDAFPNGEAPEIWQTLSAKLADSPSDDIWQTLSAGSPLEVVLLLARLFPLPWSSPRSTRLRSPTRRPSRPSSSAPGARSSSGAGTSSD